MRTIELEEKKLIQEVPECWDEMEPLAVQYVIHQASLFTSGVIDHEDFILRSFYRIAGIKRDLKSVIWEKLLPASVVKLKNANAYQLAEYYTDFMLKPRDDGYDIRFETVINFLPQFKIRGTTFFGPADLLSDLEFGEFRAALEEMNEFFRDKDELALNRMVACLYRPQPDGHNPEMHSGRKREPFNRESIPRYAGKLKKINSGNRLMILLWFTWCIHHIKNEDIIIEGRLINLSPLFPKSDQSDGSRSSAGLGWTSVLFGVSKERVFGDIKKTDKASLLDVLLFMYDSHLQNEKLKRNDKY